MITLGLFLLSTTRVFAADFMVDFHVPAGTPIFDTSNLKPGDEITKTIDVKNTSALTRNAIVRGIRTDYDGEAPHIDEALMILIKEGETILYGPRSASQFFSDSVFPGFVPLSTLTSNQTKTYAMTVSLPESTGNEFQGKSVQFDLYIDTSVQANAQGLVINEVYYRIDRDHWHGLFPDRRDDDHDLDDGGWYRDWWWQRRWWVFKKDFQWIELYNPTDQDISLRGWSLTTKDKTKVLFGRFDRVRAKSFALIAKDDVVWRYWRLSRQVTRIEVNRHFGNGLDPRGDRLILSDSHGVEIDRMSWGRDQSGFTPPTTNTQVSRGSSTERKVTGSDTNTAGDWEEQRPPSPGR